MSVANKEINILTMKDLNNEVGRRHHTQGYKISFPFVSGCNMTLLPLLVLGGDPVKDLRAAMTKMTNEPTPAAYHEFYITGDDLTERVNQEFIDEWLSKTHGSSGLTRTISGQTDDKFDKLVALVDETYNKICFYHSGERIFVWVSADPELAYPNASLTGFSKSEYRCYGNSVLEASPFMDDFNKLYGLITVLPRGAFINDAGVLVNNSGRSIHLEFIENDKEPPTQDYTKEEVMKLVRFIDNTITDEEIEALLRVMKKRNG
ncbi:hypothetical protein PQC06_gp094 [Aeromonas phage LAh10]|uniref:Uncharacterized protein n=1 Tax=Aeromonas phage LAh10 TaxID=2591025 RepID=A0A514A1G3_9CAUD|nr:hypothetical protein PQC06_gp094 [Aeromonas phage LAh10]QDH47104.1 hypothetical protein LAh10_94 [Aeromonas phage LAh10]